MREFMVTWSGIIRQHGISSMFEMRNDGLGSGQLKASFIASGATRARSIRLSKWSLSRQQRRETSLMRMILCLIAVLILASGVDAEFLDTRPEVWMFSDPGPGCIPCNSAKKFFKEHAKSLPFKVVVKPGIPEWLPCASYPTFYWGTETASGKLTYQMQVGWTGKDVLISRWEQSVKLARLEGK